MKRDWLLFGFLLGLVVFVSNVVVASQVPPSPTCEINAIVSNITKMDESYDVVGLRINYISTFIEEEFNCTEEYAKIIENNGAVFYSESGRNFSLGDEINAKVHFEGDEFFSGYMLREVNIVGEGVGEAEKTGGVLKDWVIGVLMFVLAIVLVYVAYKIARWIVFFAAFAAVAIAFYLLFLK
jgi:hypothetical protein